MYIGIYTNIKMRSLPIPILLVKSTSSSGPSISYPNPSTAVLHARRDDRALTTPLASLLLPRAAPPRSSSLRFSFAPPPCAHSRRRVAPSISAAATAGRPLPLPRRRPPPATIHSPPEPRSSLIRRRYSRTDSARLRGICTSVLYVVLHNFFCSW